GLVLGSAGAIARARWDHGSSQGPTALDRATTRDFRLSGVPAELPELVVARNDTDPAALVRKAVEALGGMKRFISRQDIVVVKPNIGWDRTPIPAPTTQPLVPA